MRLTLSNFQIHRDKTVDIPENETTYLEGDSDTGKSSCIRSLFWALFNKPDGSFFVTIGSPRGTTAKAVFEFGGHTVTRERGKTAGSKNLYALDGQTYEAFGRDVPEPVAKALNISPHAIQIRDPREPLFLVSHTPTEAAKILADACGLGVIDTATSFVRGKKAAAEAEIRKTEILLEAAQRRLADAAAQLPLADALERAAALGDGVVETMARHNTLYNAIDTEPTGNPLDVEGARAAVERGRAAANEANLCLRQAVALRGLIDSEPQGDIVNVSAAKAALTKANALNAERCVLGELANSRMRPVLCSEPSGVIYNLVGIAEKVGEARVIGECLAFVRASVERIRAAIRNEPQGTAYGLGGVRLAVAGIGRHEAERADLARMRDALRRLIDTEPQGEPIDTTELKQQRAAIPVCPTCGREL